MSARSPLAGFILALVALVGCSGPGVHSAREAHARGGDDPGLVADEVGPAPRLEASVDALLNPLVDRSLVSGSILIAKDGHVLLAKGVRSRRP
jgi:hypothetical protein